VELLPCANLLRPVEIFAFPFPYDLHMSRFDCHQIYMYFFKRGSWEVQFLLPDLKTPLPKKLTFADPEKIRELARRGEALGTSEAKQMLEYAIEDRGGAGRDLPAATPEQFAKLRRL
jgi:hypothetical protein